MNKILETWLKVRYSLYSPLYDPLIGKLFMKQRKRSIDLAEIKTNDRILIVGAGTGLDLVYIKSNRIINAIDVAAGMLNRLKRRAKRLGIPVRAELMDARNLKFPDNSFDVVLLHMIVAVIPEQALCLREVSRVVVPGGTVMVLDKFLPVEKHPSITRRIFNPLAILIASNLNMTVASLSELSCKKIYEERTGILGLFRIIKFIKPIN